MVDLRTDAPSSICSSLIAEDNLKVCQSHASWGNSPDVSAKEW